ncbi:hypothetical protein FRUB_05994 [Fimbriiglobus ruber]|uniref:Uncharacterized protein n=1 Tax=Fimbriiglobus ruber TaxID=1908690 RepID=A0A225DD10_9BACT|nr:hypothetical protein FRUB_05994 [Fimbriiglobus ruber]
MQHGFFNTRKWGAANTIAVLFALPGDSHHLPHLWIYWE